jgi:hypothetical protein
MTTPETLAQTEEHSELEEKAHALLEALDKMYGSLHLSENVQRAKSDLRELLHKAPEPDPADAAFLPPPNGDETPATPAEPAPAGDPVAAEAAGEATEGTGETTEAVSEPATPETTA